MVIEEIGMAAIAQAMTWSTPIKLIKQKIFRFIWKCKQPPVLLEELLDCSMCLSFWIGLITFGTLWQAGLCLLIAKLIDALYAVLPIKISLK